jgi:hypothetical protein
MFTRRQFSSSLLATTALGATRTAFGKIITGFPAAQSLRNIDYLGRCYNIVEVDPLTFKPYKPKTVVDFAFKAGHTSPDGRFQLPDNVAYFSEHTGTYREDQTIISSSSDFQRAVSESATISGSGSDGVKSASFSASASYSNYSREAQSKDTFSTLTQYEYADYRLNLEWHKPGFSLGSEIAETIAALPAGPSSAYADFVKRYGTHFSSGVAFGGLAY